MPEIGDLSVNTSCVLEGGDCLAALIDDQTAIYVEDTTPTDETDYQTRFLFDPNGLSMGEGEELDIFQALDDTVVAFQVQLKKNGASYDIRLQVNDDNPSPQTTAWETIDNNVHEIVVEWWADTDGGADSGGDDGVARLWIDGVLIGTLTDIDNDTHQVDKARLGAVAGIDAGTSGSMYFDDYASWTEAEGIVYDGSGVRVKTVIEDVTTVYVGVYENDVTNGVERTYYSGAMRVDDGTNDDIYWVLKDHLGSTSVVANTDTTQQSEKRYKAWGEERYTNGTLPTTVRYTGQREESDIGLYFYNARWYDPSLGRFIQADTVIPDTDKSQSYDRYAYVSNNPIRKIDPSGHIDCEAVGGCDDDDIGSGGYSGDIPPIPKLSLNVKPPAFSDFGPKPDVIYSGPPPDVPGLDPTKWIRKSNNTFTHPDDPGAIWRADRGYTSRKETEGEQPHWNRRNEDDSGDDQDFPDNNNWGRPNQRKTKTEYDTDSGRYKVVEWDTPEPVGIPSCIPSPCAEIFIIGTGILLAHAYSTISGYGRPDWVMSLTK